MNMPYRDRSLALGVVGGLEILAGLGLCGLGALVAIAMLLPEARQAMASQPPLNLGAIVAIYAGMGACLVALGAGLLGCRRWARSLSLIVAWAMAILGAFLCLTYAVLGPRMFSAALSQAQPSPAPFSAGVFVVISIAASACLLLAPGLLAAWVLGSEDARLTCEWRDRKVRWTDRCPLPVLALALLDGYSALMLLVIAWTTPAVVAGRVVTGALAAGLYLVLAVFMAALAAGLYRLRPWAWWATVALCGAGCVNGLFMLRGDTLEQMYRAMGLPEDQIRMSLSMLTPGGLTGLSLLGIAAFAAWLALIRKHFAGAPPETLA